MTKVDNTKVTATVVQRIIAEHGGVGRLAELIGCTPGQLCQWRGGKTLSPSYVAKVAELSDVPAHELRPDIFRKVDPSVKRLKKRIAALEAQIEELRLKCDGTAEQPDMFQAVT